MRTLRSEFLIQPRSGREFNPLLNAVPRTIARVERVSIGLVGFEPTASWSRTRRSTKLSHSPNFSDSI